MDERKLLEAAMVQILAATTIKQAWNIARNTLAELNNINHESGTDDE
jgi:hypothetical protein